MMTTQQFAMIGGLGMMMHPAAVHLKKTQTIHIATILDRGHQSALRNQARAQWQAYGAALVYDYASLLTPHINGVIICAGKQGDDARIIAHVIQRVKQRQKAIPFTILHLSTVSPDFVEVTHAFCQRHGIEYLNYPITGGVSGAKKGQLVIFCSGSQAQFKRHAPWLQCLGTPMNLGVAVETAAMVKLMSHVMVFGGMLGLCAAQQLFDHLQANPIPVSDLFDQLNQGAGGTQQWPLMLKPALMQQNWQAGFKLSHASADAIYTLQLLLKTQTSLAYFYGLLPLACQIIYASVVFADEDWSTQAVVQLNTPQHREASNAWLQKILLIASQDPKRGLQALVDRLSLAQQHNMALDWSMSDYQKHIDQVIGDTQHDS